MKKRFQLIICTLALSASAVFAQNFVNVAPNAGSDELMKAAISVRPTARQLAWQQLEYYAFIHFGTNTFLGKEWGDGKADPSVFNPTQLNANQWVQSFKKAGMKGVILTAKHHDGFCLWPTATTSYSVVKSPWRNGKGDLVREVADACRREGMKLGIYLSPWDRNHSTYGDSPAYNKVFMAQLTELLTKYGDVFEVWFDGACGEGPNGKKQVYDFEAFYSLVRKLQPNAVIAVMGPDVRWCGNEAGEGRDPEWSVLPISNDWQKLVAGNSQQKEGTGMFIPKDAMGQDLGSRDKLTGASTLIWYPSEVNTSIRPGWFYHPEQDNQVKSVEVLEKIYYNSIGMNASFLLNIPPDKRGLIHENDVKALIAFKKKMDQVFKLNVALSAKFSSKSTAVGFNLKSLTDGNKKTFWTTKKSDDAAFELKFIQPQTFDRFLIQENILEGQRVERFVLEVLENGNWKQVAEGKTIGYKRILCFPTVTAQQLRVRIVSSRACPQISEIGLFNSGK
jgi:alpha-L-fucosidase